MVSQFYFSLRSVVIVMLFVMWTNMSIGVVACKIAGAQIRNLREFHTQRTWIQLLWASQTPTNFLQIHTFSTYPDNLYHHQFMLLYKCSPSVWAGMAIQTISYKLQRSRNLDLGYNLHRSQSFLRPKVPRSYTLYYI